MNAYSFKADKINLDYLDTDEFLQKGAALRGSVMIIGPLIARFGYAVLPKPGGDKIGRRRLDTHFLGIQKLGATFTYCPKAQTLRNQGRQTHRQLHAARRGVGDGYGQHPHGCRHGRGDTTIYNAACEPYLQQLSKMLNRMGARIEGIGSNLLTIHGVSSLKGVRAHHSARYDRGGQFHRHGCHDPVGHHHQKRVVQRPGHYPRQLPPDGYHRRAKRRRTSTSPSTTGTR